MALAGGNDALVRALVVSPRALLRMAVASVLSQGTRVRLEAQAESLEEAGRLVALLRPTLLLIDLDGAASDDSALHALLDELPADAAVLGFNAPAGSPAARTVNRVRRGAVLDHDAGPEVLLSTVLTLLRAGEARTRPAVPLLTARQHETLSLAAGGLSNAQIAAALYISVGTVKRHLSDAFLTLGARSRIEAVNRARALGELARSVA